MEDIELRLTLKKQKSRVFLTNPQKVHYTSPAILEYQNIADKYKNYLGALSQKIDKVCEKQQYRTYLKEQKLNSVRNKLQEKKSQLERLLDEKRDPLKSPNGKIYSEILELQKLQNSYKEILEKLETSVKEKKQEIEQLTQKVKQQKNEIKNTLRQSFCDTLCNSTVSLCKSNKQSPKKSVHRESSSYMSKSRESMLSRLGSCWEEQTRQAINEQEEKIIMLRLFCVYARNQNPGTGIANSIVELVQRELKVKQLLEKQDKRSLHCD